MKKRGFTLAEVLITLSIIGVLAALTAPALVTNSRNEANAAKLSVVVSNLENAFQNAIIQEDANNLYGTSMWAEGAVSSIASATKLSAFAGNLGRYMILSGFENSSNRYMGSIQFHQMTNTGGVNVTGTTQLPSSQPCIAIKTKSGAIIYIATFTPTVTETARNNAIAASSSYYTKAAEVFIDVNGKNAPNTYGRDVFAFQLGENGVLYPYGGKDVGRVSFNSANDTWDKAGQKHSCTNADKGSENKGLGCTARVIAEGYKINY